MTDRETEEKIIQLRARGKSYSAIAAELRIGKQTALDVCKKRKEQIATLEALELEELYEKQRITATERITALASLMRKIREEIDRRDLKDVATDKLIELYLRQASALKEEMIEPDFKSTEEQATAARERKYLERLTAAS